MPSLILLVALLELGFTGPITAGVPLLSASSGWKVQGVGWLLGAFGIGAAATAGGLAIRRTPVRSGLLMGLGLLAIGIGLGSIGAVSMLPLDPRWSLTAATAAAAVVGCGAGLFGTLVNTALLLAAPQQHLGRVMSVVSLTTFTALPISLAATSWLVEWTSSAVPFLAGAALITAGAVLALAQTSIRTLRTVPRR